MRLDSHSVGSRAWPDRHRARDGQVSSRQLGLSLLQQVSEEIIYLVELTPVSNRKEDGNEMFLKFG